MFTPSELKSARFRVILIEVEKRFPVFPARLPQGTWLDREFWKGLHYELFTGNGSTPSPSPQVYLS